MPLTVEELQFIMQLISDRFGRGYSDVPGVGRLQAKLSILAEVASNTGRHSDPIPLPEKA